MSSKPPQRKSTRISSHFKKPISFPTAHSTGKYQKTSVIRTLEAQVEQLSGQNSGHNNVFQTADTHTLRFSRHDQGSLENSQERRFNLNLHSSAEHSAKKSHEKMNLINQDYHMKVGSSLPTQSFSYHRLGQRGFAAPLALEQDALQQYQSIPMTRKSPHNFQFKSFQRNTQALMIGLYSHKAGNRKYVKSVERKAPPDKKRLLVFNPSGSNSKLSNSYQQQEYKRRASGITLNNSIVSAINIYDSLQNNQGSTESLRFRTKRQIQSSQNNIAASQNDSYAKISTSSRKRISLKNLQNRYKNKNLIQSYQPLQELRNAFHYVNSSKDSIQHQNLLIQQNESYFDGEFHPTVHTFSGKKNFVKYQTLTNMSHSTIGVGSSHKIPLKSNEKIA